MAYSSAHYGAGTLPIMLDDIVCSGSEDSVYDCTHRPWGENNCGHGEDAGVACSGMFCFDLGCPLSKNVLFKT